MLRRNLVHIQHLVGLFVILSLLFQPQATVHAASAVTIEPITWNVVGLDSNNVNVGPNEFPIGARACNPSSNSVSLLDVEADFVWLSGGTTNDDTYIHLRPGSLDPIQSDPQIDLAPGECYDFYFEVEVSRNSSSYDQTRRYRIDISYEDPDFVDRQVVNSPTPREVYVERLISQNRNETTNMRVDGVAIPVGGAMNLMVGEIYTITLDAKTATQGYEQIESFIHFPNTIFQVLDVSTSYSADTSAYVDNPNDQLYGDSCLWENNPDDPNYRSCLDVGKNGGIVQVDYTIKIISGAGTSDSLNSLIYDFSGSSYHYNSDYSSSYRSFNIIGPSNINISKRFLPDSIAPGETSTLAITLTNPTTTTVSGANFTDPLPTGMIVDSPTGATTSGCGTPTFAPAANDTSLAFSDGTIAANSSCTIKVNVTVSSDGSYDNGTDNLFINDTVDTENSASATLTAGSAASCLPDQTLATWTFPTGSSATAPAYTTKAGNVATAVSSTTTSSPAIETNTGNPAPSWSGQGFPGGAYFQFRLDTNKYSDIAITFDHVETTASWNTAAVTVSSSADGLTFTSAGSSTLSSTLQSSTFNAGTGATFFRISATGAQNNNSRFAIDNVTFTGCLVADPPPTLVKAFSSDPIIVGESSTLTFTIDNSDVAAVDLTGINFSDSLPAGLEVANPPNAGTTCAGSPTWSPTAGATSLTFGTPTGATLATGSSCTAYVDITATTPGQFENISGSISSTQSGENKTSDGYATDTLSAIAPPDISKSFAQTTILTGSTTDLSFQISNPNPSTALTGIAFTDTLPTGLTVADSSSSQCGGTLTSTAVTGLIAFSGGSLAANDSCTFTLPVTGVTAGTKVNTTSIVTSVEGGDGDSATATVYVKDPAPELKVLKQVGLSSASEGVWSKFLEINSLPTNVYYKFTVENVGDVDLTDVSITDAELSNVSVDLSGCSWANLTTADPIQVCVVGPLTVTDSGKLYNTATADGTYGVAPVESDPSSATYGTSGLTLSKSVTDDYFTAEGDSLEYSYVVTNTGNVPLYGPVTVSDDKVSVTCPSVTSVGDGDNYLDPADYPAGSGSTAESVTCTATYTIIADDVTAGSVTNTASATVDGVTSPDDAETAYLAALTIDKDTSTASVNADGTVTYTIEVENTGSIALTDFQVTDSLPFTSGEYTVTNVTALVTSGSITANFPGYDGSPANAELLAGTDTLEVGATATITITVALSDATPGTYDNTATATTTETGSLDDDGTQANDPGTPGGSSDPEDDEDVTILGAPELGLSKSDGVDEVSAGGTTTYTLTVSNTGNADSSGTITVVDVLPTGLSVTDGALTLGGTNAGDWNCNAASNVITCTSSAVIAASTGTSTFTFTVDVDADATGTLLNQAQVGGGSDPTNPDAPTGTTAGQCTATDTPNEGCAVDSDTATSPDLSLVKSNSVDEVSAGGTTTYTLTVSNTGNVDSSGTVTVVDVLPSGLSVTDGALTLGGTNAGDWNCTAASNVITCTSSAVIAASTGTSEFNFTVDVDADASGTLDNLAQVGGGSDPTNPDAPTGTTAGQCTATDTPNEGCAVDSDTTISPDLSLTKSDGVDQISAGGTTTYTLTVSNTGNANSSGTITVVDVLPTGLSVTDGALTLGGANAGDWSCSAASNVITCTSSAVIAASTGTSVFSFTVDIDADASGTLNNLAQVGGGGDPTNPDAPTDTTAGQCTAADTPNEGCAVDSDAATAPDLGLSKNDGASQVSAGGNTTYTLTISNTGNANSSGTITVVDVLPTGLSVTDGALTLGGANAGDWSCNAASNVVTCTSSAVIAASTGTSAFSFTVDVDADSSGTLDNLAQVGGGGDPTNPDAPTSTTAGQCTAEDTPNEGCAVDSDTAISPDLSLSKSNGVDQVSAGGTTTYTLTVSNTGNAASSGTITVVDVLPSGLSVTDGALTLGGANAGDWSCNAASNVVTCTSSAVIGASTGTSVFSFTVDVDADASGTLLNRVLVGGGGDPTNPDAPTSTTAGQCTAEDTPNEGCAVDSDTAIAPNLGLSKSDDASQVSAGGTTTYTLTVSNTGNAASSGTITVVDVLPTGLSVTDGALTLGGANAGDWSCNAASNVITCTSSAVIAASTGTSAFSFTVDVDADASGTLDNLAQVGGGGDPTNPDAPTDTTAGQCTATDTPNEGCAVDSDTAIAPNLNLAKSDGVDQISVGDTTTYTLTVSNTGNADSSGTITVVDVLPSGLSVTDGALTLGGTNAGDWSCSAASNVITCTSSAVIAASTGTSAFSFTVDVDADASGTLLNQAQVGGGSDPTNPNAPTTTTVEECTGASTPNEGCAVDSDDAAGIGVTKTITNVTFEADQFVRLNYSILVENSGNTTLNNIQVTDDLTATFALADSFSVESLSSTTLSVNVNFDGDTDGGLNPDHVHLLTGTDSLAVGASGTILMEVLVDTGGRSDIYTNEAVATGRTALGLDVEDSDSIPGPSFIDPAVTKAVDVSQAAVGDLVTFTITVVNNGTVAASNVVVTDALPDNLNYVSATSIDTATSAPRGTITLVPPRTVSVAIGDLDTTDVIEITIVTRVNSLGQPPIQNEALVEADPPADGVSPDPTQNNTFAVSFRVVSSNSTNTNNIDSVITLPVTGFAPNQVTVLPEQKMDQSYSDLGNFWLEIPDIGVKTPIVGVPLSDGVWDVDWLWNQSGWLHGTAFPTWEGNSVLTGHVYLPNGRPGPFIDLKELSWGDQIIVHYQGHRYTYEVREVERVSPQDLSPLQHEDRSWITLITCQGYDETRDLYNWRLAVKAVQISAESE